MRADHLSRPIRRTVERAAVLAVVDGIFLDLVGADVRETGLAVSIAFAAVLAAGCLLHWRDIVETVRGRQHD